MSQDNQQQSERAAGLRPSRDTLLLLGALLFLILAVALTFFFTPNNGSSDALNATALAGAATTGTAGTYPAPSGIAQIGTAGAYPGPAGATSVVGTPAIGTPQVAGQNGTPGSGAYPEPGAVGQNGTPATDGYPGPAGGAATATAGLPDLIPTSDPDAEPSPAGTTTVDTSSQQTTATTILQLSPTLGAYPDPVGEGTPPAQPTFNPTVAQPTLAPPPTLRPANTTAPVTQPTQAPPVTQPTADLPAETPTLEPSEEPGLDEPTATAEGDEQPTAPLPIVPAAPAADVLRGNVRWSAGQSPIVLRRDVQIAPGAELIVEPGVEVRLDPGVSIYVDGGKLLALGTPSQPVRFVGNTGARWSGIFGRPDGYIALENTEIRGGGAGGTVLASERGELVIRSSRISDNGGSVLVTDSKLEMRDSELAGNDMPFGAALEVSYARGNFITLRGNRIAGNRLSDGAPMVRVANSSSFDTLNLAIEGNLVRGGVPNLQLSTDGPLKGTVLCNALVGDGLGFGLRTQTPQVAPNGVPPMQLQVENNFMDEHIPPVIPVYLKYGLGRGATSEILLDMRNNWWGEASGPYEPDTNPLGRGDSVGSNIVFAPWLAAPPACAPPR